MTKLNWLLRYFLVYLLRAKGKAIMYKRVELPLNSAYDSPWNIGQTFLKMVKLPTPKYCPNAYSINSSGMPIKQIIKQYGSMNAPEIQQTKNKDCYSIRTQGWMQLRHIIYVHKCHYKYTKYLFHNFMCGCEHLPTASVKHKLHYMFK